jgi:threonine dehydratase
MTDLVRRIAAAASDARPRVEQFADRTPLRRSEWLSEAVSADVFIKLENLQLMGSFKIRGAANCLMQLRSRSSGAGVITASTGNHGAAVARIAHHLEMPCHVMVPEETSNIKASFVRRYGAELELYKGDALETEIAARNFAVERGLVYVSPYNDFDVIAGQGTIASEMIEQCERPLDSIFVSVGGGGLVAGIASVLDDVWPSTRVVGCSPAASPVMARSVQAGHVVDIPLKPTLSDGTAGGIEEDTITLEPCISLVDQWIEIDESEILHAMQGYIENEAQLIEGSAAVAVAGVLQTASAINGSSIGVVICGSNLSWDDLRVIANTAHVK